MSRIPHSPAWYDHLATTQQGYHYPWKSHLPYFHGEDIYDTIVINHTSLDNDSDVLEVACAHGELARHIAHLCGSITAYDRVEGWIQNAREEAKHQGIDNVTFLCHDSSIEANGGQARLPGEDGSYDLLICSKGPFHWIDDAKRVARPGATLLMLVPDFTPLPEWHDMLPEPLQWQAPDDPQWARHAIEERLTAGGLALDSWWSFDVPETFTEPEQLYVWRTWGKLSDEVPPLTEVHSQLEQIFKEYGTANGLAVRYRRYIWKAIIPE